MYIVTVDFVIDLEMVESFMPLMRKNAERSLLSEPGCRQFDVCISLEQPGEWPESDVRFLTGQLRN